MKRLFLLLGCWLTLSLQAEVELTIRTLPGMPVLPNNVYPFVVELSSDEPALTGKLVATLGGEQCVVEVPLELGPGSFRYHLVMPVMAERTNTTLAVRVEVADGVVAKAGTGIFAPRADWHIALLAPPHVLQQATVPKALSMTPDEVDEAMAVYWEMEKQARALDMKRAKEQNSGLSSGLIFAPSSSSPFVDVAPIRQAWSRGELTDIQFADLVDTRDNQPEANELLLEISLRKWQAGEARLRAGTKPLAVFPRLRSARLIPVRDPSILPEKWYGYQPLEIVVWEEPNHDTLTHSQISALRTWIQRGGRLLCLAADEKVVAELGLLDKTGFGNVIVRPESWQDFQTWPRAEVLALLGGPPDQGFLEEHLEVLAGGVLALDPETDWPTSYYERLIQQPTIYPWYIPTQPPVPSLPWGRMWLTYIGFLLVTCLAHWLIIRQVRPRRWAWVSYLILLGLLIGAIYLLFYKSTLTEPVVMTDTVTDRTAGMSRTSHMWFEQRVGDAPLAIDMADGYAVPFRRSDEGPDMVHVENGLKMEHMYLFSELLAFAKTSIHDAPEPNDQAPPIHLRRSQAGLRVDVHQQVQSLYVIWRDGVYRYDSSAENLVLIGLANSLWLPGYPYGESSLTQRTLKQAISDTQASWLFVRESLRDAETAGPATRWPAWQALADDRAIVVVTMPEDETLTRHVIRMILPVDPQECI